MLRTIPTASGGFRRSTAVLANPPRIVNTRFASTQPSNSDKTAEAEPKNTQKDSFKSTAEEAPKKRKTQAELDEEVRQKLEGIAGDGGAAGMELENGQPVSMKRGVKNNMFRYI